VSAARAWLGIIGGFSAGYAVISLLYLTPLDFGVGTAISATAVVAIDCIRHVERSRQRERDKARHPSVRYWNAGWQTTDVVAVTFDLPRRMLDAADTIEEASAFYGYRNASGVNWSADMLRKEAQRVTEETP
jgi:hypothetical protein